MTTGTGNKSSIAFTDTGLTGSFKMIGSVSRKLGKREVSDLDTEEVHEFAPEALATDEDTEFEIYLSTSAELPELGNNELITLTFKQRDGETAPATYAAWGFISERSLPQHVNNETQMIKCAITWTNRNDSGVQVKPVWTKATTS